MAPDWGLAQVVIALAILPLVVPGFVKTVGIAVRQTRLTIWKKDGQCDYLTWEHVAQRPRHPIHTCMRPNTYCADEPRHAPGESCWRRSFDGYFNTTKYRGTITKPSKLPIHQSFLCVDKKLIEAFILSTLANCDDGYFARDGRMLPQEFNLLNLAITAERHEESGEVLVHVLFKDSGPPNPHRNLTPHEIDCLLGGYPPYYREYLECYNHIIPSPIQSATDIYRGGWIIGVGLTSERLHHPLPVFVNTDWKNMVAQPTLWKAGDRGPTVFWRPLYRVLAIVENNIKQLYTDERNARNIQATIDGLKYMIRNITESGVHTELRNSDVYHYERRNRELSAEECITAMAIFNESPHMDDERLEKLKEELTPMLLEVLNAALRGAISCVSYIKNGGRDFDTLLPKTLIDAKRVFLTGCQE
ncbi:hypothetical protein BYT27DRAFT_7195865 [Phlegmacium glaucopus]|nr:hypothetical protein BYT27DRAFT_7195865 [Phlegmacium glaucopus]